MKTKDLVSKTKKNEDYKLTEIEVELTEKQSLEKELQDEDDKI
jgi:hypothetical protein